MDDKKRREILDGQNWEVIVKKLTVYAYWKIHRKQSWNRGSQALPKGIEPYDIAMDAIIKTLDGVRKWDYVEKPDLIKHLENVIDSDVWNLCQSKEHKAMYADRLPSSDNHSPLIDRQPDTNPSSEEELIAKELDAEIRRAIEGDDELETLYLCIEDEMQDKDIAEVIGCDIKKVYNLKKKLRRRISTILDTTSSYAKREKSK